MAKQTTKKTVKKPAGAKANSRDAAIRQIILEIEAAMHHFIQEEDIYANLTGTERKRLISARSRNYGFIDKAYDIARDNPTFLPPNFNVNSLYDNLRDLEDLRQLMLVVQQFLQLVTNSFMQQADFCFRDALRIYASLQEQTRARVPGAEPLFESLRDFFHRRRREGIDPTEKELERDIKKLLHGTADGEIVIENVSPKMVGGSRKVVDNIRKGKTAVKETADAEVIEGSTRKK